MFSFNRFRRQVSMMLALAILMSSFIGSHVNASENENTLPTSVNSVSVTSSTYSKIEIAAASLTITPSSTQTYSLTAYDSGGTPVQIGSDLVTWQADSSIGTISANGVLTAPAVATGFAHGYVHATYDGLTTSSLVLVGNTVATVFEDFESTVKNGKTVLSADRTTSTAPIAPPSSSVVSIVNRQADPVLYGNSSAKLSYNMLLSPPGTFGVYLSLHDLATGSLNRPIPDNPKKVGVWVYGDESMHWLRARLRNVTTSAVATIDFVPTASGINWKGWRYVTVDIPSNHKFMDLYVVETNNTKKNASVIYFDQLSVFYTNTTTFGLDIQGLTPMKVGQTRTAQAYITKKDSVAPELTTNGVTYLSSRPDIASVDGNGQVTALKSGKTSIVALYADAQPAVYELTVSDTPPVVDAIELFGSPTLEAGRTNTLLLRAAFAGQTAKLDVTADSGANMTSSNTDVAIVESNGKVKALSVGTSTITATFGGQTASYLVTVIEPVPVLTKIQLVNMHSLTIGSTLTANVNAIYNLLDQPQSPVLVSQGVTFTSSKPSVATIDASGVITASNVGVTLITATLGARTATYSLVVNQVQSAPKREMRAAWVASVENIDWPKKGVVNAEQQRQAFKDLLDSLAATGINAIITQVRPTSDALYPSELNPWSEWLTGTQGQDPGYDPLAFMIEEARKRNMEFHAWFNPYRIRNDQDTSKLAANSPAKLHPEWVVDYGGKLGYNPGIPAVKQYVIDSVMEVVKKYDIDGVHFDDYFYPYPVTGVDYPDSAEFAQYGTGLSLGDWRRHNVDSLIQELSQEIKLEKPYVQFGISPFGIWKNKSVSPDGSDTNGLQSYDTIYADTVKWIQQGWIDYVTPQLYWYINYGPAAYDKLVDWWKEQVKGRNVNLYTGNGVYKVGEDLDPNWQDPEQIPNQIKYNRNFADVKGTMLFGASSVLNNPLGVKDNLANSLFRYPALLPQMSWLDAIAPDALQEVSAQSARSGVNLNWRDAQSDTAYYVIYRAHGGTAPDINDPATILKQVRKQPDTAQSIVDTSAISSETYSYIVTAVDRLHNESPASESKTITYVQPEADPDPVPQPGQGSVLPSAPTTDVQVIQASELQSTNENQVTITVKPNVETIQLPAHTASLLGGSKDLVLQLNALSIIIPNSVLTVAERVVPSNDNTSKLIFSVIPVSGDQLTSLENKGEIKHGAKLHAAAVYHLKLTVQSSDGTSSEINTFVNPMRFTFTVPQGIDASKAQVYYVAENGELAYVDGQLSNDKSSITASISHFSTYGIFEFNKTYNDVANGHWAYTAVDDLSRKLIVNGVDDQSFGPERSVTRAEFTALLVRALGMKEATATPYQDVQSSDWFASEVAIAHKLGIVTGMTDTIFDPNGTVSREQMATMLVRAYLINHPHVKELSGDSKFSDFMSVQEWAKPFVNQAAQLGLVTGREMNVFAPSAILNRAESAQAIFNLLHLIK
ncbi:family 10 glycosylhydrolase [Paenibacillus sp. LMG 31461]|uniref:Family 10 glycosylhydrolase n=1 Tax=Paenibacillus plantarum TaxID=2654975 RepID=A0ABX1XB99_9BACL|nr:family 10 glycosylhydrolase [Paenibacillus plantarum]NOU65699.1 family 10 glycosylhydrolase [Paenibacillus plantarum]